MSKFSESPMIMELGMLKDNSFEVPVPTNDDSALHSRTSDDEFSRNLVFQQ
jgi:hypothetical protein